jgi:hypothetical protein
VVPNFPGETVPPASLAACDLHSASACRSQCLPGRWRRLHVQRWRRLRHLQDVGCSRQAGPRTVPRISRAEPHEGAGARTVNLRDHARRVRQPWLPDLPSLRQNSSGGVSACLPWRCRALCIGSEADSALWGEGLGEGSRAKRAIALRGGSPSSGGPTARRLLREGEGNGAHSDF